MSRLLRSSVALGYCMTLGSPGFAERRPAGPPFPNLKITVLVYNYVHILPSALTRAEKEAGRVLGQAGVQTEWLHCRLGDEGTLDAEACRRALGASDLVLKILPRPEAADNGVTRGALGFGYACPPGNRAAYATVFYQRIEEAAKQGEASESQLLGHAVAHELGHVLIGSNSHSERGIMRARWVAKDLKSAARRDLNFTAEQTEMIRAEMLRRSQVLDRAANER